MTGYIALAPKAIASLTSSTHPEVKVDEAQSDLELSPARFLALGVRLKLNQHHALADLAAGGGRQHRHHAVEGRG